MKVQTWVVFSSRGFLPSQSFSQSPFALYLALVSDINDILGENASFIILRLLILARSLSGPSTCISVSRMP